MVLQEPDNITKLAQHSSVAVETANTRIFLFNPINHRVEAIDYMRISKGSLALMNQTVCVKYCLNDWLARLVVIFLLPDYP